MHTLGKNWYVDIHFRKRGRKKRTTDTWDGLTTVLSCRRESVLRFHLASLISLFRIFFLSFFLYYRQKKIRSEKQFAKVMSQHCTEVFSSSLVQGRGRGQVQHTNINRGVPKDIFEMSEVVLPSHQNHMKHLFGGTLCLVYIGQYLVQCGHGCSCVPNTVSIICPHQVSTSFLPLYSIHGDIQILSQPI